MKNRLELAKYFMKSGFKVGAEIGVASGAYSLMLCETIPNLKLYCVDTWGKYDWRFVQRYLREYEMAKIVLDPFDTVILRKSSMEALLDVREQLDFVYIDADHRYMGIKEDIEGWSKKVRKGGIVSGHDYYKEDQYHCEVKRAVDEYVKKYGYMLNVTVEKYPNWWFQL